MVNLKARLALLEGHNQLRRLRKLSSPQGRTVTLAGRELLNFSSNDYLGLAANSSVREAARAALDSHGFGAGSARLLVGNFDFAARIEARLSDWLGAESCLLFSSGYHANLAILPTLADDGDRILTDELNHASIIDGCRLSHAKREIYPHTKPPLAALTDNDWVVTESLFSMDGDWAPIASLEAATKDSGARLIVDEAHTIGVHGKGGSGLATSCSFARIGTMGKALGSYGAFIAGSHDLIALLRSSARSFMFTTALPAPVLAASLAALNLAIGAEGDSLRARLSRNCAQVAETISVIQQTVPELSDNAGGLQGPGLPAPGPMFSLELGSESRALSASFALEKLGILVQAIRPPTVPLGRSRLRLVVTAVHTTEDLVRLESALKKVLS